MIWRFAVFTALGLIQSFLQIDELAAIKTKGSQEGQHIGVVPPHRCIDVLNALGLVIIENRFGEFLAYPAAHEIGIDTESGNPGALLNTETSGQLVRYDEAHQDSLPT
jgi:hypothetical protein